MFNLNCYFLLLWKILIDVVNWFIFCFFKMSLLEILWTTEDPVLWPFYQNIPFELPYTLDPCVICLSDVQTGALLKSVPKDWKISQSVLYFKLKLLVCCTVCIVLDVMELLAASNVLLLMTNKFRNSCVYFLSFFPPQEHSTTAV